MRFEKKFFFGGPVIKQKEKEKCFAVINKNNMLNMDMRISPNTLIWLVYSKESMIDY